MLSKKPRRARDYPHPYLSGNFAPVQQGCPLTPCSYTGTIPEELYGGEYVRNGGNPVANEDLGREAHWFDGDGMLSGVSFKRTSTGVQPEFVSQFILTDVYLSTVTSKFLKRPVPPSIATLVNPLSSILTILLTTVRTIFLVVLSHLSGSAQTIRTISVANTSIVFHDGRALATCEAGPPIRVALPGLETVGWFNGRKAEGEPDAEDGPGFGGDGLLSFMKEWTTAHPRVDPKTGELILFHSTFIPPYVYYSTIPATHRPPQPQTPLERPSRLLNAAIPGFRGAKMMHDFGVSAKHTVILDLPMSLDPINIAKGMPVMHYDPRGRSKFGVFPRHRPDLVRRFETSACCIFHTANTWDENHIDKITGREETTSVHMLACRLTSNALVFRAGDIVAPVPPSLAEGEEPESCRLHYLEFDMTSPTTQNKIKHEFSLTQLSFEFPSVRDDLSMSYTRYVFGCSTTEGTFTAALGRAAKIDCLVKIDVETLIKRGKKDPMLRPVTGCVDNRSIEEIMASTDSDDPLKIFRLPKNHFAQEPRFIPRRDGTTEDDGWLVTYVFDETQLDDHGECKSNARSELWIVDARDMKTVVARIQLPTRVPYGLHGIFVDELDIQTQRPTETIRSLQIMKERANDGPWSGVRRRLEHLLA